MWRSIKQNAFRSCGAQEKAETNGRRAIKRSDPYKMPDPSQIWDNSRSEPQSLFLSKAFVQIKTGTPGNFSRSSSRKSKRTYKAFSTWIRKKIDKKFN